MLPAQPNQSLIDGLACLQALASNRQPIGGRELARQLDLDATRVNRLLKTLAHLGLAEQDERRKYRCGPGIHVLAAQAMFGSGILRPAVPHLEALRESGFVVAMGVMWRDRVAYLYHASPNTPPGEAIGRVGLFPAHTSGIGLAILAQWRNARIESCFAEPGRRRVALAGVRAARKRGYALAVRQCGEATVALPLPGTTDVAIGLAGELQPRKYETYVANLRHAADQIAKSTAGEYLAQ